MRGSPSANHFSTRNILFRDFSLQLLTVVPNDNSLALVYRDKETLRFVKHINRRASVTRLKSSSQNDDVESRDTGVAFYDFSAVYFE